MQTVHTIGHSTRTQQEFLAILRTFSIEAVADIRTIPRSRKNPQYDQKNFKRWLNEDAIDYIHFPDLGGLRHPRKDSVNTGWKNASFRGYADYMQSVEFESAVERLISLSSERAVVMLCAEAVPWRCHRTLAGDALLIRGIDVRHIMSASTSRPHVLTPWARVDGLHITYPAEETT
ncbi:MAG: DUF488 family protein [Bryobacteraceae bacterium]